MNDVDNKVKMIVEGLLLAAGKPLTLDNIAQVFSEDERPDRTELKAVLATIEQECHDRGFELKQVASGYRFQVRQELSEWVARLWEERPPRYTRALLETLALIAYRQPITRGDIEEIRGVGVSPNIVRTLLDREWIRVVGHRDVPGRPAMFATTRQFLDYFNLKSLQELPPLAEIKELGKTEQEPDLIDDLANVRILELPEDAVDENSVELNEAANARLLAEEEAVELSKKPLDEILNLGPSGHLQEPGEDETDEADEIEEIEEIDKSNEDDGERMESAGDTHVESESSGESHDDVAAQEEKSGDETAIESPDTAFDGDETAIESPDTAFDDDGAPDNADNREASAVGFVARKDSDDFDR